MDINKQEENIVEGNANIEHNNESDILENNELNNENLVKAEGEDNVHRNTDEKIGFAEAFFAATIDLVATGLISAAVLFIFDAILRAAAGYFVKDVVPMFLIVYLIVTLLYTSIMESSKNADTIGKRVARLKLVKTQ